MKCKSQILSFLCLFFIAVLYTNGEELNTDSLNKVISSTPEKDRPELLLKIANDVSTADIELAEDYIKKALNYSLKQNNLQGIADAYSAYGDAYLNNNIFDKALLYYQKALPLEVKLKNFTGEAYNLSSIGFVYYYQNDIDKAIEYFNKALVAAKDKSALEEGNALNSLGSAYRRKGDIAKAKTYFEKALPILQNANDKKVLAKTYQNLGLVGYETGEYENAIKAYQRAYDMCSDISDKRGKGIALNNIGNVYYVWGKFENAVSYYQKALKIFEEINYQNGIASCYTNIGNIFIKMKNFDSAKEYLEKAVKQRIASGPKKDVSIAYSSLANLYSEINNEKNKRLYGSNWEVEILKHKTKTAVLEEYRQSLDFNNKALKISEEINDKRAIANSLNNIGTIYSLAGILDKALNHYQKALAINREIGNQADEIVNLLAIGIIYNFNNNFSQSEALFTQALAMAQKLQRKDLEKEIYRNFASMYENSGEFKKSLQNFKLFSDLKDTILNKENYKQVAELQTQYETDKKQKEIALLNKDKKLQETQIKQQRMAIVSFIAITLVISILIVSLIRQNKIRKKINQQLADKNFLITEQKKEITDSIHYASRIQRAILPPEEVVAEYIPDHFIFFRPRDIVSGDFYYFSERDGKAIVVTADCTGHGVPGAFMSMLGSALLHEIVNKIPELKSDLILNELRANLVRALHQTGKMGENRDGMDLTLYILDREAQQVEYSGANNPLIIVRNGELIEVKADKMPIGIHDRVEQPFASNTVDLQKNDMIYTYSDGYIDQFGGPEDKKFMSKKFKQLLTDIATLKLPEQNAILEKSLLDWIGKNSQIDDILVIGVRV